MIQRIQTVYLIAATALLLSVNAIRPSFAETEGYEWLDLASLAVSVLTALVALAAVFLYKNRKRQLAVVNLARWGAVLLLAALIARFVLSGANLVEPPVNIAAFAIPVVAYGFLFLAARGVNRDMELVRSMDRLR